MGSSKHLQAYFMINKSAMKLYELRQNGTDKLSLAPADFQAKAKVMAATYQKMRSLLLSQIVWSWNLNTVLPQEVQGYQICFNYKKDLNSICPLSSLALAIGELDLWIIVFNVKITRRTLNKHVIKSTSCQTDVIKKSLFVQPNSLTHLRI